jgi:hypothetical protein
VLYQRLAYYNMQWYAGSPYRHTNFFSLQYISLDLTKSDSKQFMGGVFKEDLGYFLTHDLMSHIESCFRISIVLIHEVHFLGLM